MNISILKAISFHPTFKAISGIIMTNLPSPKSDRILLYLLIFRGLFENSANPFLNHFAQSRMYHHITTSLHLVMPCVFVGCPPSNVKRFEACLK